MAVVLIIGASRGLGLEFVRQYTEAGDRVIATVRDAAGRARVQALGAEVLTVDVSQPASVSGLAWQLDGEKIDTALYVAGVYDAGTALSPPTRELFDATLHTNVLGAMQVLPQVAPLVQAAGGVFALLCSEMSRLDEAGPDAWLYRVSKAALNMVVASSQMQWPGARVVALDPGWVQTDMGGAAAPLTLAQSVQGLVHTLASVKDTDAGHLLRYDGVRQSW